MPELKDASSGMWKDADQVAEEWRNSGSAVPEGITNNSEQVIAKFVKLIKADPELHHLSHLVYATAL